MGTTPTYSWPYPEPTDPVANGAQDIEDLALAVETTVSGLPAGKILQVVSTTKTDTFSASVAAGADTAITGLSATITPSSTGSKILAMVNVAGGRAVDAARLGVRLFRGATEVGSGASASNRSQVLTGFYGDVVAQGIDVASATYLDSPATTSATTYSVNAVNLHASTTLTVYVNRSDADTDDAASLRTSSTITLMEVSA